MSLLAFVRWCDQSAVAETIRQSVWMFPVIEAVHLLALALLGGAVLVVDLRLLGWGLSRQPLRDLARELHPWMLASLATLLVSGALMFVSEAFKCYESPPFRLKMLLFAVALLFTFTIRRKVTLSVTARSPSWLARTTGLVSIGLWTGVGLMGRAIGFW
jgi:hypothetical protein